MHYRLYRSRALERVEESDLGAEDHRASAVEEAP